MTVVLWPTQAYEQPR